MDREDYTKFDFTYNDTKKIFCMANINEMEMWRLFTQDQESDVYHGSLRSKRIPIHEVANTFGGGGHKHACGVKNLNKETIDQLIHRFNEISES